MGHEERYRKVSVRVWNDKRFMSLSDDGQLLFLFLLTHPAMTSVGAMRHTLAGLAAEKRWTSERMKKAFKELPDTMVRYDGPACCIWLPNFLRHNPPANPNVVKGWGKALQVVPEADFYDDILLSMVTAAQTRDFDLDDEDHKHEAAVKSIEGVADAVDFESIESPEPEPIPEQGEMEIPYSLADDVKSAWNTMREGVECADGEPLPKTVRMTKKRRAALNQRASEEGWLESWREAVKKVPDGPWLCGHNPSGWKADIEWFLKPDSVTKIMEGKYDGQTRRGRRDVSESRKREDRGSLF